MLTKNQSEILMLYRKDIFLSKTIREISIMLNKSYPKVFEAIKSLEKENIISIRKAGKSSICEINPNERTIGLLSIIESELLSERKDLPLKNINKIANKIKNPFYILIICGSYAEGKQKSTSDLDIAIIIPDSEDKKNYTIALKEGELIIPEVHGYVFNKEEFHQMLINEEFNYGKELVKKHIIYYGAEQYYKILFGAMKNGFKI